MWLYSMLNSTQARSCGSWKSQKAEWAFSVKEGLSVLVNKWWREKKEWGAQFRWCVHTNDTRISTMVLFWKSVCVDTLLSVCFLALFKHCSMSDLVLHATLTTAHTTWTHFCTVSLSSTQKCNLTHGENIAWIRFSSDFHSSVTKVSKLKKR